MMVGCVKNIGFACVIACVCGIISACHNKPLSDQPTIVFDQVPPIAPAGGAGVTGELQGHVRGARAGQRIVLYALSNNSWWIQPLTIHPFTMIASDGAWGNSTHVGTKYAALLVNAGFTPRNQIAELPRQSKEIAALATVSPTATVGPARHLRFSNYDWEIRQVGSDRNGSPHTYDPANASVDAQGFLHLSISRKREGWSCSEVSLPRSLGYGTYSFSVSDISALDPATVLSMFTWDTEGTDQNRREVDIVISRWGDPKGSNAEFIVQPYFRPANTYRYIAPVGVLSYSFRWEPGRIKFTTRHGEGAGVKGYPVAENTFTADVPAPKSEAIHINFCNFEYTPLPQQQPAEVVLRHFQFLP